MKRQIFGRIEFIKNGILISIPVGLDSFSYSKFLKKIKYYGIEESQIVSVSLKDNPRIKKHKKDAQQVFYESLKK